MKKALENYDNKYHIKDKKYMYTGDNIEKDLEIYLKENDIKFAVDIYPFYGSDVDSTLNAGYDIRHGLIGSGVYASHGYERSHRDGVENTLKLIRYYLED